MKFNSFFKTSAMLLVASMFIFASCNDNNDNKPEEPTQDVFTVKILQNENLVNAVNGDTIVITEGELSFGSYDMRFDGEIVNNTNKSIRMFGTSQRYFTSGATDEFCDVVFVPSNGE